MNFAEFGQRDDWQLFRRRRGLRCVDGASKRARVDGGDGLVREAVGQRFALFAPSRRQAGIELPCEVPIGKNFVIEHSGGIVVSGYAKFGDDCRIRNGVVIGLSRVGEPCAPVFGNHVDVGAGAKVLGNIRIGNNVCIGANAVVLQDVPDNCIAVGVPATIKMRNAPGPVHACEPP